MNLSGKKIRGINPKYLDKKSLYEIALSVDSDIRFRNWEDFKNQFYSSFCEIDDVYSDYDRDSDGHLFTYEDIFIGEESISVDNGYSTEIALDIYGVDHANEKEIVLTPIESILKSTSIGYRKFSDRSDLNDNSRLSGTENFDFIPQGTTLLIVAAFRDSESYFGSEDYEILAAFVHRFVNLATNGIILGSSTSYGYGRIHCIAVNYVINNLDEHISQILLENIDLVKDPGLNAKLDKLQVSNLSMEYAWIIITNKKIDELSNKNWITMPRKVSINVHTKQGLLLQSRQASNTPEKTHFNNMLVTEKGIPYIPASTIKGIMNASVQNLSFNDCILKNYSYTNRNRTHLDSFSGGIFNQSSKSDTVVHGEFTITIDLITEPNFFKHEKKPDITSCLSTILRFASDLNEERFNIGSGYAIGLGFVEVDSINIDFSDLQKHVLIDMHSHKIVGDKNWLNSVLS